MSGADHTGRSPIVRRVFGEIAYIHETQGITGRERWNIAVDRTGVRTVTANCVMNDVGVQRDVMMSVGPDFRPLEAFVRLGLRGEFQGATWFRFTEGLAESEGFTMSEGRISQRLGVDGLPEIFAPHPVQTDGWQTAAYDRLRLHGRARIDNCFNPSPLADGASGPMLSPTWKDMSYDGEDDVTVPAGRFACRRYSIFPRDFPDPLVVHVTGEDRIMVLCTWATLKSRYELVSLKTEALDT